MTYPENWTGVRDAAINWAPPEDIAEAYFDAISKAAPPLFCVPIFDMLKLRTDLDADGMRVALGCAHLINRGQWFDRTEEAIRFIGANAARHTSPAAL